MARWERIRLPMQETRVQSLGREDPLEKEMASHSNILAGKSQGQRSLVGCSAWGCKRARHDLVTKRRRQQKSGGAAQPSLSKSLGLVVDPGEEEGLWIPVWDSQPSPSSRKPSASLIKWHVHVFEGQTRHPHVQKRATYSSSAPTTDGNSSSLVFTFLARIKTPLVI